MNQDLLTRDLLERAKAGDNEAFTILWDRYWPRLLEWADGKINGSLKSRVDAEDILQTVFRTFFQHLPSGRYFVEERGKLWVLLVGIARNKIRQKHKRESAPKRNYRQDESLTPALLAMLTDGRPSSELRLLFQDEVDSVLQHFPPLEAEIARLALWDDFSQRKIADISHTSLSTVRRILNRFKILLKTRFSD